VTDDVPPVGRPLDLAGRVAIVTGASGGVGAEIAGRLAEAGAATSVPLKSSWRPDDLVQIEHAASKILVEGPRYPENLERMSGRRGCWSVSPRRPRATGVSGWR
jgi:hypothetical protein